MEPIVCVRFMEEADLDAVLACERRSHEYVDPDFGVPQMPAYAWSKEDILEAVSQYRSSSRGTNDTRAVVAEVLIPSVDESGLQGDVPWVCGGMIYEIQPDGYEILFLTVHPGAPDEVRPSLLDYLLNKAARSENRKRLTFVVPDGDYRTLKFFQDQGWGVKLLPSEGNDGWECEYRLTQGDESRSLT